MKRQFIIAAMVSLCVGLSACASSGSSESTGQYLDSSAVTAKVKSKLVRKLGVGSTTSIHVTTYKGVVQLSGFVKNREDIGKAIQIAKTVKGVKAVENSLLVKNQLPR